MPPTQLSVSGLRNGALGPAFAWWEGRSGVRTRGCKLNWVNSLYWLVIEKISPLF